MTARAAEVGVDRGRGCQRDRGAHRAGRVRADPGLRHDLHERGAAGGVVVEHGTAGQRGRDRAVEDEAARVGDSAGLLDFQFSGQELIPTHHASRATGDRVLRPDRLGAARAWIGGGDRLGEATIGRVQLVGAARLRHVWRNFEFGYRRGAERFEFGYFGATRDLPHHEVASISSKRCRGVGGEDEATRRFVGNRRRLRRRGEVVFDGRSQGGEFRPKRGEFGRYGTGFDFAARGLGQRQDVGCDEGFGFSFEEVRADDDVRRVEA